MPALSHLNHLVNYGSPFQAESAFLKADNPGRRYFGRQIKPFDGESWVGCQNNYTASSRLLPHQELPNRNLEIKDGHGVPGSCSIWGQLGNSLNQAIAATYFGSSAKADLDPENLVDAALQTVTSYQDALAQIYGNADERTARLQQFLGRWLNVLADGPLLQGLSDAGKQQIVDAIRTNVDVLIQSMPEAGNVVAAPEYALPEKSFYIEKQCGQQCSRHAANAFFERKVFQGDGSFENLFTDQILHRMEKAMVHTGNQNALVMYDTNLGGACRAVAEYTLQSLDQLDQDGFVLNIARHYVCFKRDGDGQWWLLDSLNPDQAQRINPSEYISNVFGEESIYQYYDNLPFNVICRDEGRGLPASLYIVSGR